MSLERPPNSDFRPVRLWVPPACCSRVALMSCRIQCICPGVTTTLPPTSLACLSTTYCACVEHWDVSDELAGLRSSPEAWAGLRARGGEKSCCPPRQFSEREGARSRLSRSSRGEGSLSSNIYPCVAALVSTLRRRHIHPACWCRHTPSPPTLNSPSPPTLNSHRRTKRPPASARQAAARAAASTVAAWPCSPETRPSRARWPPSALKSTSRASSH